MCRRRLAPPWGLAAQLSGAGCATSLAPFCYDGVVFRRRKPVMLPRDDRWRALAERLDLSDASDRAERIRRWLDLDVVELQPVYALRREGLPTAYLFDTLAERRGPSGTVQVRRSHCLVRSGAVICSVAFRALPRQDKVLESLQASRSGAVRLEIGSDPEFEASVSLYTRDPEGLAALLTTPIRRVLRRLLAERQADAISLVVGERHVVASFTGGEERSMVMLEGVLADTMSLVSLLPAVQRARDEVRPEDLLDLG